MVRTVRLRLTRLDRVLRFLLLRIDDPRHASESFRLWRAFDGILNAVLPGWSSAFQQVVDRSPGGRSGS
jgi:hypothetical protein